jgi:arsenate reductase
MLTVYGIPNCDTIKKTTDYLKTNNLEYIFHDYKKQGISQTKLEEWLQQIPLDKLVNKKGTTYRAKTEEQKQNLEQIMTAIPELMASPSMIKRPIIEDQKIIAVGYDQETFDRIFK